MRYVAILASRIIDVLQCDEAPVCGNGPSGEPVVVLARADELEHIEIGMLYSEQLDTFYHYNSADEQDPVELFRAKLLLGQMELLIKQQEQDAVLAEILLGQQEV